MKQETMTQVLNGLDALIHEDLRSTDPGRYARITKLCGHAHRLLQMSLMRVADVRVPRSPLLAADNIDEIGVEDAMMGAGGALFQGIGRGLGGGDATDMIREMVAALDRQQQRNAPSPAQKLNELLDLRERLVEIGRDTVTVDRRIDEAANALAAEEDSYAQPTDHPPLARALLLRGHPTPGDEPQLLHLDRREADGTGAGGARGAGEESEDEVLDDVG